ncbi:MAG: tetratricopeptide repeat protein, partial [Candidatus Thorarchaeota archaeon]
MSGGTLPKNVVKLLSDASAKLKEARSSNDPTKAYEDAIELTKKATELSPEASEVWSAYAMALLCLCKRNEAWKAYRQSLKLVKGKSKSVKFISRSQAVEFARMHEDHGRLDEAEEQLSLLTDHSPKYPGGWLELARFYLRTNRLDDAEFTLTHGLHEIEHETLYLALAEVQALCGRLDQALYRTKEALTIKPDFFEALMHVGLYGHRLDREKEEKEALTKAADLVKKHPELKEKYEDYLKIINESDAVVFWKQEFVEPEPSEVEEEEPELEPEIKPTPVSKLPPKPKSKLPPKPEPIVTVTKPDEPRISAKSGTPEEQLRSKTEDEPENPHAW